MRLAYHELKKQHFTKCLFQFVGNLSNLCPFVTRRCIFSLTGPKQIVSSSPLNIGKGFLSFCLHSLLYTKELTSFSQVCPLGFLKMLLISIFLFRLSSPCLPAVTPCHYHFHYTLIHGFHHSQCGEGGHDLGLESRHPGSSNFTCQNLSAYLSNEKVKLIGTIKEKSELDSSHSGKCTFYSGLLQ